MQSENKPIYQRLWVKITTGSLALLSFLFITRPSSDHKTFADRTFPHIPTRLNTPAHVEPDNSQDKYPGIISLVNNKLSPLGRIIANETLR